MLRSVFIYGCILFVFFGIVRSDRKVTATLNPGCDEPSVCKNVILVHVKAEGATDTLHHLWDFTGKPSLLLALTEKNTNMTVLNWQSFSFGKEGTVSFDTIPIYTYGVVIDKMIEFNDEEDIGALNQTINNSSYISLLDTKNFNWKKVNFNTSNSESTLIVEATEYNDDQANIKKSGTVRIVLSAFGGEEHSESLPHLLHSGNASQLDISLQGISTQFKNSRFGLRLIAVSSDNSNSTMEIKSRKTLDDEHAPGIFTVVEMLTSPLSADGCGGYLQWRPVVYTSASRDMTSSTESVQYSVISPSNPRSLLNYTLIYSALGMKLDNMMVAATNVTFGISGDGFYRKNKFAAWSVLVGYGHPPEEQFSMLVTLVLLIGLGLPTILILTGTVCIVVRRLQRNKDDLFLSR